jgi:D-glycero-beta-D-manno-heptose-7-phosphate kinase
MLAEWVPRLAGLKIIVVGDVILDEYVIGRPARMSREAPIPVLEFESRQLIPGGAANPAANIVRLGSTAVQVGVTGVDTAATQLRQLLQAQGIETNGLVNDTGRPTTVKLRLLAQMGLRFPQQVARIDTLSRTPINGQIEAQVRARLETHLAGAQAVLVSDYHGGLLTDSLVASLREVAAEHPLLLAADAQGELDKYAGFGVVKCNAGDAQQDVRRPLTSDADFGQAAQALCQRLQLTGAMVITRGPQGATLATANGEVQHCPAPQVTDVYDVVGAGDTSIAVLTLARAAGADYGAAMTLANYASGLVVRRVGNYAPTPAELMQALGSA